MSKLWVIVKQESINKKAVFSSTETKGPTWGQPKKMRSLDFGLSFDVKVFSEKKDAEHKIIQLKQRYRLVGTLMVLSLEELCLFFDV